MWKKDINVSPEQAIWKKDNLASTQPPPTMATYTDAMNQFTKAATAFMEHVHLLTEAREAYQSAMAASTALRNRLETGDQALRSLMIQMEQVVSAHLGVPALDKKKQETLMPESLKVEAIRTNGERTGTDGKFLP
jgi:hypothetical protein